MKTKTNIAWGPTELELLKANYSTMPWAELLVMFGRSLAAIDQRARSMGLRRQACLMTHPDGSPRADDWTEDEVKALRSMHSTTSMRQIGKIIGRATSAVQKKAWRMGLKKKTTPRAWTAGEDAFLTQSQSMPAQEIAAILGRTRAAISMREFALKLRRRKLAPEAKAMGLQGELRRHDHGPNTKAIGTERVRAGKLERKVANTGRRNLDWKRVDVIEWEALNGRVPDGMMLVKEFRKPRTVENLKLVAPADMPLTAVRHNMPAELRKLLDLKSQIGAALSRIERKNPDAADPAARRACAWSDAEIAYLRTHHGSQSIQEIAIALGRTKRAILFRRQALGLASERRAWSSADRERLTATYPTGVALVARELGCSKSAVYAMASKMGLNR